MITSRVTYKGDLRTEAIHLNSNSHIITDAPLDNNGKGEAFSPTDLVATALGSCMLTIIGIKTREKGIDIEGIGMDITKIMGSNPRKIDEIIVNFTFPEKNYSADDQELIEEAARTCPVALSIDSSIKQTISFNF